MVKSIIKMLGITLGCSCSAMQAQANAQNEFRDTDAFILTTFSQPEPESLATEGDISVIQDIDKIYAL